MSGPLAGIRVLEFSQIVAAPYCGLHLADLGADVVKVEPPGGESLRRLAATVPGEGKYYHSLNRGKRSLVLDLKEPAAQSLVHRIVPRFDIVIINSRPGVPQRLRVDYETLREYRPDLIYVENSGYGTRGPSAKRSGSDIVVQAFSGLMAGDGKTDPSGAPEAISAAPVGDLAAGLAGAMGVCAALFHRALTGQGQYVGTSLLASALSLQGFAVGRMPATDAVTRDPMLEQVQELRDRGASYREILDARRAALRPGGAGLYYGTYVVKDGAIVLGSLTPANADQMRRVLGIEDDPTAADDFNVLDPASAEASRAMRLRIEEIMLGRTMDEWMEAFDAEGAPVSRVNLPEELADDPQVQALGLMLELDHELTGPERMVGPVIEMSETATGSALPSPPLGRHSDEILEECGLSATEIAELREAGAVA